MYEESKVLIWVLGLILGTLLGFHLGELHHKREITKINHQAKIDSQLAEVDKIHKQYLYLKEKRLERESVAAWTDIKK